MAAGSVLISLPSRTGIGQTDAVTRIRPLWIDPEGAQVIRVSVGVLDQRRLAGRLVDGEDRDRVLAAREHLLALEVGQPRRRGW